MEYIDSSDYKQIVKDNNHVIMFCKTECEPCKKMIPIIAEVAAKLQQKVRFSKSIIEEDRMLAVLHNVSCFPTFVIYKNNSVVDTLEGTRTKDQLTEHLNMLFA